MKFHLNKCKVLFVTGRMTEPLSLISVLPFYNFVYSLGGTLLDYVHCEKDLGAMVTSSLDWKEQCSKVLSKANPKLGISRRNCHFVIDSNRRRVLYLTLVRSQFEHCSIILRPVTKTQISTLEGLQKRAIKWILHEEYISYSPSIYIQKCNQLKIMPIADRFDFLDLVFFLKIVKGLVPVSLPAYIIPCQGHSRLRSSHLDSLSFVSTIIPRATTNAFARDFFFRANTKWNHVSFEVRDINSVTNHSNANSRLIWWKKSSLGQ